MDEDKLIIYALGVIGTILAWVIVGSIWMSLGLE